jgi:predicted ATP-dependent serine protease
MFHVQHNNAPHLHLVETESTRARVSMKCIGCRRKIRAEKPPNVCPACGTERGYVQLELADDLIGCRADHVQGTEGVVIVPSFSDLFPDGLHLGTVQLWWGGPGAGKSRIALRLAGLLGCSGECSVYGCLEMGDRQAGFTVGDCGAVASGIRFLDDTRTIMRRIERDPMPPCVVIDSIQEVQSFGVLRELRDWAHAEQTTVILVSQINARGKQAGGPKVSHLGDTAVLFKRSEPTHTTARVLKSRYGIPPEPARFYLGANRSS